MDTSVKIKTDRRGRRTGPRRRYSIAEKRQIVQETRAPGASVADVARAHGINQNVVFGWRRLAQRGLLREASTESASLLPVRVESPTVLPSAKSSPSVAEASGSVEVEFPGGLRVRVLGAAEAIVLERVFKALRR